MTKTQEKNKKKMEECRKANEKALAAGKKAPYEFLPRIQYRAETLARGAPRGLGLLANQLTSRALMPLEALTTAASRALTTPGRRIAISTAISNTTINTSVRVKPAPCGRGR